MKNTLATRTTQVINAALIFTLVSVFSNAAMAEKINLNTADAQAIQYIPGIGLSKAEQIIEERVKLGKFSDMDQIDAVSGIGERTMIDIRKYGSLDSGVSVLTEEMKANQPLRSALSKDMDIPKSSS